MDYTTYETYTTSTTSTADAGIGIGVVLAYLAVVAFLLVAMWKIYSKAGQAGWKALVPIYNTLVMLQMVGRPMWWIVLLFIPFVNIIFAIIITNDLSKSFGKDVAWTVGLILLPFVFYPILAFGKSQYVGPGGVGHHAAPQATPFSPTPPTPPAPPAPTVPTV
jgi:hypothetical protein